MNDYRSAICQPISEENPQGNILQEDADFDFIESQLMKVGSLAHEEIEWALVEKKIIGLLSNKSKDFKLFSYLMQTMQYQTTPDRFILSINLLSDFIKHFWLIAYPFAKDPKRGPIGRLKLLNQIVQRTVKSFHLIDLFQFDENDKTNFVQAITDLEKIYTEKEINPETIGDLSALIQYLSKIEAVTPAVQEKLDVPEGTHVVIPPSTKVVIDSSDERMIKKTLTQMGDFLSELNQTGLSLQMRRLALWHTIYAIPSHKSNGETELAAVPSDKVAEYQEQLHKPTEALWKKIEQSISLSPYWFDGHYLSYQVAERLGMHDTALLIREELARFLARMPELIELSFKGGIPFLSATTKNWLDETVVSNKSKGSCETGHKESVEVFSRGVRVQEILNESGFDGALGFVNEGLKTSVNQRDEVYWRLALAELFMSQSLNSIALEEYLAIEAIILRVQLPEWESDLVQHLSQRLEQLKN